jgi:hypothetical protein
VITKNASHRLGWTPCVFAVAWTRAAVYGYALRAKDSGHRGRARRESANGRDWGVGPYRH